MASSTFFLVLAGVGLVLGAPQSDTEVVKQDRLWKPTFSHIGSVLSNISSNIHSGLAEIKQNNLWQPSFPAGIPSPSLNSSLTSLAADYQSLDASTKQEIIWKKVQESPYTPENLPIEGPNALESAKVLLPTFLRVAFTHISDEMPEGRKKLIHSLGSVAKIQLEIFPNSTFSGVFKSGGVGFARLSWAKFDLTNIVPGVAIKLLIDGKPSQNFLVMHNLDGQGSNQNFFLNPVTNAFPNPTSTAMIMLSKVFAATLAILPGGPKDHPEKENILGLYEQASVLSNGQVEEKVVAPWKINLVPSPKLSASQGGNRTDDFRTVLAEVPEGTVLYDVVAYRRATSPGVAIGRLISRSAFVASQYGDEKLYFQHAVKRWQA
jgi:hypothetical protein